jgi:thioredoxin reductase (NADPH)
MYDVIIIGLGCAAYTAAIYTARYKLSTLIVGAEEGGMGITAAEVGNWPGIIDIKGPDLMENFKKHALSYEGVEHRNAYVKKVELAGDLNRRLTGFRLTLENGEIMEGKTVIFATGSEKRKLGIKGEKEFLLKGVTYCATCDAFFYKGKDVAVLGGGDAAVEGAAIAAQVCKTVYLIHRRKEFRAEPYWVDKVKEKKNIVFVLERNAVEILGEEKVTGVKLDKEFEGKNVLPVAGVFIEIGADPASKIAKELGCDLDERNFVKVDEAMRTSVPGVFGAGDVTSGSNHFAQFTTAAGEGAIAANSVFNYLQTGGEHGGGMHGGNNH